MTKGRTLVDGTGYDISFSTYSAAKKIDNHILRTILADEENFILAIAGYAFDTTFGNIKLLYADRLTYNNYIGSEFQEKDVSSNVARQVYSLKKIYDSNNSPIYSITATTYTGNNYAQRVFSANSLTDTYRYGTIDASAAASNHLMGGMVRVDSGYYVTGVVASGSRWGLAYKTNTITGSYSIKNTNLFSSGYQSRGGYAFINNKHFVFGYDTSNYTPAFLYTSNDSPNSGQNIIKLYPDGYKSTSNYVTSVVSVEYIDGSLVLLINGVDASSSNTKYKCSVMTSSNYTGANTFTTIVDSVIPEYSVYNVKMKYINGRYIVYGATDISGSGTDWRGFVAYSTNLSSGFNCVIIPNYGNTTTLAGDNTGVTDITYTKKAWYLCMNLGTNTSYIVTAEKLDDFANATLIN